MVKESEIRPDPVCVQLNDVVAWLFGSPRQYDVTLVETVDQVLDVGSNKALTPRWAENLAVFKDKMMLSLSAMCGTGLCLVMLKLFAFWFNNYLITAAWQVCKCVFEATTSIFPTQ